MSTSYPGREDEFDLGNGYSFAWMTNGADQVIGLIETHPRRGQIEPPHGETCGGYVAWIADEHSHVTADHHLARGGPGEEDHLTVTPSLLCPTCGNHGFITDGKWVGV